MQPIIAFLVFLTTAAFAADEPRFVRDNLAPIETLDLAAGPGGIKNQPVPPFRFVEEMKHGISPKLVVTDASNRKWVVKFGEEAKPENFASRIAWAAGYVVRPSYYVASGTIQGVTSLKRTAKFVDPEGRFRDARFQVFDRDDFREIPGSKVDLYQHGEQYELNGLKLTLLLVANWDVKPANTAVFAAGNQRYGAVTDWGASMGDPAAIDAADRKWSCKAYSARTNPLVKGAANGYIQFDYSQYASRHEHALADGIRVEDLKMFLTRMGKITDNQVHAALVASGANPAEAKCFTRAFRERLDAFAAAAQNRAPGVGMRSRSVTPVRPR